MDKSKEMQKVRITTAEGKKVQGILNVTKNEQGAVKEMYVDVGCDTREEVEALGVAIGDMAVSYTHLALFMSII